MDEAAIRSFSLEGSRRGYAAGRGATKIREADHSTTIVHERGDWTFHDNYFGGEPYGGREVVFVGGRPIWMAVYYGWVEDGVGAETVYAFLQRALREAPAEFPVRGPSELSEAPFTYRNARAGSRTSFSGEETIRQDERLVYTARYLGGLVDRREGD